MLRRPNGYQISLKAHNDVYLSASVSSASRGWRKKSRPERDATDPKKTEVNDYQCCQVGEVRRGGVDRDGRGQGVAR